MLDDFRESGMHRNIALFDSDIKANIARRLLLAEAVVHCEQTIDCKEELTRLESMRRPLVRKEAKSLEKEKEIALTRLRSFLNDTREKVADLLKHTYVQSFPRDWSDGLRQRHREQKDKRESDVFVRTAIVQQIMTLLREQCERLARDLPRRALVPDAVSEQHETALPISIEPMSDDAQAMQDAYYIEHIGAPKAMDEFTFMRLALDPSLDRTVARHRKTRKVVGYCIADVRQTFIEALAICVQPSQRRRDVGGRFVDRLIDGLDPCEGPFGVQAVVSEYNVPAQMFFKANRLHYAETAPPTIVPTRGQHYLLKTGLALPAATQRRKNDGSKRR